MFFFYENENTVVFRITYMSVILCCSILWVMSTNTWFFDENNSFLSIFNMNGLNSLPIYLNYSSWRHFMYDVLNSARRWAAKQRPISLVVKVKSNLTRVMLYTLQRISFFSKQTFPDKLKDATDTLYIHVTSWGEALNRPI